MPRALSLRLLERHPAALCGVPLLSLIHYPLPDALEGTCKPRCHCRKNYLASMAASARLDEHISGVDFYLEKFAQPPAS